MNRIIFKSNIIISRKEITILLIAIILIMTLSCTDEGRETTPNIIIILADDLGYGGIGCYGNNEINTPNLDLLASKGIKFIDFHSNGPVCTPTRAALLTGKYQQKSGLEGVLYVRGTTRETGLDTAEITIADLLNSEGYETAIMGKWHLGYNEKYNPVYNGFSEFYGYRSGNIDYHSHFDNSGIYDWYHNLNIFKEQGYVTDLITRHSVDFIERNQGKPFFLFISHEAPHVPFQGRNDSAYRFPDKEFTYYGPVNDRKRAYKEMVEVLDEGVGTVMEALRNADLFDNTFIFFLSDNGGLQDYGHNGNLHGAKTELYEGGHRVPAIACWKEKIKSGISKDVLMSFDLFPTIMAICGIDLPEELNLDGVDFSFVLFEQGSLEERDLFWKYKKQKAIRSGNMKLLITDKDTLLFNLDLDVEEKHDVGYKNEEIMMSLKNKLRRWDNEISDYKLKTK